MNLTKRTKIALFILLTALVGSYAAYKYAYKPHTTINELDVKFSGTANAFYESVQQDALKWQDVAVELEGTVTSIDDKGFVLNHNVYCQLNEGLSTGALKEAQTIKIKGRMIGYDDLLDEVKLDQTIIK